MSEDFPRRRDDIAITELATQFADFVKQYEKDRIEDRKREDADWKHTQEWRKNHWEIIDANSKILAEIAPNYRRGMIVLSTIVLGTIGCAIKAVWTHITLK